MFFKANAFHRAIKVLFTIGLYQIIEVNEPQQYILLNSWIVERWKDELLYWDIDHFEVSLERIQAKNNNFPFEGHS